MQHVKEICLCLAPIVPQLFRVAELVAVQHLETFSDTSIIYNFFKNNWSSGKNTGNCISISNCLPENILFIKLTFTKWLSSTWESSDIHADIMRGTQWVYGWHSKGTYCYIPNLYKKQNKYIRSVLPAYLSRNSMLYQMGQDTWLELVKPTLFDWLYLNYHKHLSSTCSLILV